MSRLVPAPDDVALRRAVQVRVIYADTDRMGVVYHGTYARYLEHARVELIRQLGVSYTDLERRGVGLPVTESATDFRAPAVYDDLLSVWVGIRKLTYARLHFAYRITVEPGDRPGLTAPLVVLHAETRHGCVGLEDGRATRIPDDVHEFLAAHYNPPAKG
jgi:acyl-CoA thioester hydrolase